MNDVLGSAEGPTRSGFTFVWTDNLGDGKLLVNAGLAMNGYDWAMVADGTVNILGEVHYDNFKLIDGRTDFSQKVFSFNVYATDETGPVAALDYSKVSDIQTIMKVFGYNILGITFDAKIDIDQSPSGTGHVIGYWDTNEVWPESSKYLELYWWDGTSGIAGHGSWETWDLPALAITASSGAW